MWEKKCVLFSIATHLYLLEMEVKYSPLMELLRVGRVVDAFLLPSYTKSVLVFLSVARQWFWRNIFTKTWKMYWSSEINEIFGLKISFW